MKNMDYVGMALLVALFACNALAIDSLYNNKTKTAGLLNIGALCLTVALAYNFKQIENIMTVFLILVVIVLVFFVIRFILRRKKNKAKVIDIKEMSKKEEMNKKKEEEKSEN